QATSDGKYLARCAELFDLFSAHFFQSKQGSLCEYLSEGLNPLPDVRGRVTEPGHHYEWVWLLRAFQRASGRDVGAYCTALYDHADRYGWDDHVDSMGRPIVTMIPASTLYHLFMAVAEAARVTSMPPHRTD